jgi:hypothetical protein
VTSIGTENLERQLEVEIFLECHEAVVIIYMRRKAGTWRVRCLMAVLFVDVESSLSETTDGTSYMMPSTGSPAVVDKYHQETFDATTFFPSQETRQGWGSKGCGQTAVTVQPTGHSKRKHGL